MNQKHNQTFWVFIVSLLEMSALGMIIPLIPYLGRQFGADDLQVGLLMSIYSLLQCGAGPFWGSLSDQKGRKFVLLLSLFFTFLSYLWFALAPSLLHLFFSRALAGVFGAGAVSSFALISDLTPPKTRSKNLSLIGAAFGLGFIIGPLCGGVLSSFQNQMAATALAAGVFCLAGFFLTFFFIKKEKQKTFTSDSDVLIQSHFLSSYFYQALKNSVFKKILFLFFILSLCLTLVEAPLFLWMKDQFEWPLAQSYWGFAYMGLALALSQGFFARILIPHWGEQKITSWGFTLFFLGLFGFCFSNIGWTAFFAFAIPFGYGFAYAGLTGSTSLLAGKIIQGRVFGIHQSLSSMTRIIGPALGGWLYRDLSPKAPFLTAGVLALMGFLFCFLFKKSFFCGKKKPHYKAEADKFGK